MQTLCWYTTRQDDNIMNLNIFFFNGSLARRIFIFFTQFMTNWHTYTLCYVTFSTLCFINNYLNNVDRLIKYPSRTTIFSNMPIILRYCHLSGTCTCGTYQKNFSLIDASGICIFHLFSNFFTKMIVLKEFLRNLNQHFWRLMFRPSKRRHHPRKR